MLSVTINHHAQVALHWEMYWRHQYNVSQQGRALESQPKCLVTNFTHKDTNATWVSGFPMENVEL